MKNAKKQLMKNSERKLDSSNELDIGKVPNYYLNSNGITKWEKGYQDGIWKFSHKILSYKCKEFPNEFIMKISLGSKRSTVWCFCITTGDEHSYRLVN